MRDLLRNHPEVTTARARIQRCQERLAAARARGNLRDEILWWEADQNAGRAFTRAWIEAKAEISASHQKKTALVSEEGRRCRLSNTTQEEKPMKLVNCTPHALNLHNRNGEITVLKPSGIVPRVDVEPGEFEMDIPECAIYGADEPGHVVDLPESVEGTFYIVSGMVGGAMEGRGRGDLLVPGTGPKDGGVRHPEKGFVIGVTRLKRVRP